MWDVASGAEAAVLRGHKKRVWSVSFSPDGTRIVSASHDKTVRVWDAASGAELAVLRGHKGGVRSVSFFPDGTRIAICSFDHTVRVRDATSGECLEMIRDSRQAVGPHQDPLRIVDGSLEVALERSDTAERVAWFPGSFYWFVTRPQGRTWAGSAGNHLSIISLEGSVELPTKHSSLP